MTDLITAARAMIEPLTGYTPRPWRKHSNGNQIVSSDTIIASCVWGAVKANTRLIAAAPDLRDMVSTLADALEAERAKNQRLRETLSWLNDKAMTVWNTGGCCSAICFRVSLAATEVLRSTEASHD